MLYNLKIVSSVYFVSWKTFKVSSDTQNYTNFSQSPETTVLYMDYVVNQ